VTLSLLLKILIIRLSIPVNSTRYITAKIIIDGFLKIVAIIGEKPSMNTGV
jgi:hypothetical protein